MKPTAAIILACALAAGGCASPEPAYDRTPAPRDQPSPGAAPERTHPRPRPIEESFEFIAMAPGLRVDAAARVVEFDSRVATDVHHPDTPVVYLEVLVCSADTREHESLVVTDVAPSLVHAAMLAAGFFPGAPGAVTMTRAGEVTRRDPTGEPVRVEFFVESADTPGPIEPAAWVIDADTRTSLVESPAWDGYVFAGSVVRERAGRTWYGADGEGTIVGLATFGTETIAPTITFSHESRVDAPTWIARREAIPAVGTPVRVRLSPADAGALSDPDGA
ncbi:MAG: hypothetical protein DHS20C14_21270 [Phycisphaeraceae bacterium]|nr:MAG: hypothetical protein DHS20C14_21270 [Phycisphaeraceae bacterium]